MILPSCKQSKKPVDMVYPLLDGANSRWFYFSSATRPFGMVSLFPDNVVDGAWDSGYRYSVDTIRDFSHIHEWQLSGVAVMPVTLNEGAEVLLNNWASLYSHKNEVIKPGYHSVFLERYKINAELTSTNRVGFHRYKYPKDSKAGVIFQLSGQLGPSYLSEGGFTQHNDYEVSGYMVNAPTIRRPKPTYVFFNAHFNKPIEKIYLSSPHITDSITEWSGEKGNILLTFKEPLHDDLLMKVAVSYTSEGGAQKNMKFELPGWHFNKTVKEAQKHWNDMLSRIIVEGGTLKEKSRFYTDLWKALQGRRVLNDVDGKYADMTGEKMMIRQIPLLENGSPIFSMYNSDSFWGAQWTLNTLWHLVYPEITEDFCNSFVEYYKNGGLIPRGPSGGNYTFVMNGASTTPFFVSAWQKGIRNFDICLAYKGLIKNHLPGGLMSKVGYEHNTSIGAGLEYYIERGYVPYPLFDTIYGAHQDGAGITLENAYQDWCLAQLANTLGVEEDYEKFIHRSQNFKNLYNEELGFMVPRNINGEWMEPYDPLLYDNGFIEGNGAQFTWFVPHDLQELFKLMGGKDLAVERLNQEFRLSQEFRFCNQHPEKTLISGIKYINDRRTWINYSNQPNSQVAFIFNHAGAPWLTQYWSRVVVDSVFSSLSPYFGYNGDEDQGLMGSLAVLMKIGLFQMNGGCDIDPIYEIGSPIFDKITIHLHPSYYHSPFLVIKTKNNGQNNPYIQSATLNKEPLSNWYFRHSDINKGAELILNMGDKPNKKLWIED